MKKDSSDDKLSRPNYKTDQDFSDSSKMKVCGFTFIRNAEKFDFPVNESINSVLPICDSFVVAVGNSTDSTREIIERIPSQKIQIVDTVWDDSLKKGGEVYADETNKAFDAIPSEFDWCFYIQADEVIHEKYLDEIKRAMKQYRNRSDVDGLLFGFKHFFATYDFVGDCRHWYRKEIRVIRNNKEIRSYKDAQGFRKNGRKLKVVQIPAVVYHYGWVRHPKFMQDKINSVKQFYKGISEEEAKKMAVAREFNYSKDYDALSRFEGSHPRVMKERIKRLNWKVEINSKKANLSGKYFFLYKFEKLFGIRLFEYKNYRVIK